MNKGRFVERSHERLGSPDWISFSSKSGISRGREIFHGIIAPFSSPQIKSNTAASTFAGDCKGSTEMPSWRASSNCKRNSSLSKRGVFIVIVFAPLLSACSDEPAVQGKPAKTPQSSSGLDRQWLEIHSSIKPAQWVLDWRHPKERSASDEEMQRVQKHLTAAHSIYRESERMIANRAVQLEQMLAKLNVQESAANILEDISSVAGEIGQTEGFGAVSQHYYILRSGKYDREAALALLKQRYGTRTVKSTGD